MNAIDPRHEDQFWQDMATHWQFEDNHRLAFVQRLLHSNDDLNWVNLADVLTRTLRVEDPAKFLQDSWNKKILPRLLDLAQEDGFGWGNGERQKWKKVRQWHEEKLYPSWLWQQVRRVSLPTTLMGVRRSETVADLKMFPDTPSPYLTEVPVGSAIIFEGEFEPSCHLLLLERDAENIVYCLCPSKFAPNSKCNGDRVKLPQAKNEAFQPSVIGSEQLVAILSTAEPSFSWWERARLEAMALQSDQLQDVLNYVETAQDVQVLYSEYQVV